MATFQQNSDVSLAIVHDDDWCKKTFRYGVDPVLARLSREELSGIIRKYEDQYFSDPNGEDASSLTSPETIAEMTTGGE